MAYPFLQAKYFTRGGLKEARGIVLHMAEGFGTASWLTHPTNDNSSHFVVERTGRIVQMVGWADADHSLHIGRPSGPPGAGDYGIFSLDVAEDVLGSGINDPNAYLIAIEVEGYALRHEQPNGEFLQGGPNAAQVVALGELTEAIESHYGTIRGLLGHRDFQNYKPCPGPFMFVHFPHGRHSGSGNTTNAGGTTQKGAEVRYIKTEGFEGKLLNVGDDHAWLTLDGQPGGTISKATALHVVGLVDGKAGQYAVEIGSADSDVSPSGKSQHVIVLVRSTNDAYDPELPPASADTTPFSQADLDNKVAAELERAADRAATAVRTRA